MDNRMPLYQNIVLSGGTTMLPGLATRLERDITHLYLMRILKVRQQALLPERDPSLVEVVRGVSGVV